MKNVLKGVGGLLGLFIIILLFNTFRIGSNEDHIEAVDLKPVNIKAAVDRLSGGLKIPTISQMDSDNIDYTHFVNFNAFLRREYPNVFHTLDVNTINTHSLLFKWTGEDETKLPILLMAHMDVVPIDQQSLDQWTHPPFDGTTDSTTVWGRGAMDDKGSLFAIMESVSHLIGSGFTPKQTIYIAFGHDEEIGGTQGAKFSADYFKSKGVTFDFVLDEGGGISNEMGIGIEKQVAFVAVSEKGYVTLELVAKDSGGHSSMPGKETTIGILANAIAKLQANPLPAQLNGPIKHMLNALAPEMGFLPRMVMANQWIFGGVLDGILSANPSGNAMVRTTTAPTIFSAGVKDNVIPAQAKAMVNFRIIPGDTPESVIQMVTDIIDDTRIEVRQPDGGFGREPAPVSDPNSDQFKFLSYKIQEVFPGSVVVPGVSPGGTDTKHFVDLSPNIFRFSPIEMQGGDQKRIHGIDERVGIKAYEKGIQFYIHLIESLGKDQRL